MNERGSNQIQYISSRTGNRHNIHICIILCLPQNVCLYIRVEDINRSLRNRPSDLLTRFPLLVCSVSKNSRSELFTCHYFSSAAQLMRFNI